MTDLVGHVFYLFLVIGLIMVGRGVSAGWALRLIGSAGWAVIGFVIGMSSIWLWSLVFVGVDLYNWNKWRND